MVQELAQELESIKLKLKEMDRPMERRSVEFMAYKPSGYTRDGSSDDRIANGTNGQSKFIENSKTMLICSKFNHFKNCIPSV